MYYLVNKLLHEMKFTNISHIDRGGSQSVESSIGFTHQLFAVPNQQNLKVASSSASSTQLYPNK